MQLISALAHMIPRLYQDLRYIAIVSRALMQEMDVLCDNRELKNNQQKVLMTQSRLGKSHDSTYY